VGHALRGAVVLTALLVWGCATPPESDPWEKMNRKTHAFNEGLDHYVLIPVATAWDFVFPEFVQTGIRNIFDHVNRPVIMVHNLLQGEPRRAHVDLVRFVANTIFGLGGLVDVASMDGVPEEDEDWDQTLAVWGVDSGPYLVLPFFGPSTPRGTVGLAADSSSGGYSYLMPWWGSFITTGTQLLNTRAIYLEEVEQSRRDAFDYYIFVRDAYLQNRANEIANGDVEEDVDEDDLYFFDDEEFDEFEEEEPGDSEASFHDSSADQETPI
jgi:phospholipid-binding lipoprotein MlaA